MADFRKGSCKPFRYVLKSRVVTTTVVFDLIVYGLKNGRPIRERIVQAGIVNQFN